MNLAQIIAMAIAANDEAGWAEADAFGSLVYATDPAADRTYSVESLRLLQGDIVLTITPTP